MKLVVNEPTLDSPTEKQMSATERSVFLQQRGGALEPAGQQVPVRRLAEGALELAAEVRARQPGGARQVVDVERLEVAGVGEVLGAEQVTGGRDERHRLSIDDMGERTSYPPGTFSWAELVTSDADAAKGFYTQLFGWEYEDNPTGPDGPVYSMAQRDGHSVAALFGDDSQPPHWNCYVTVASADEAARKAARQPAAP